MIRSLVIRQSFIIIDIALAVILAASGVVVLMKLFEAPVHVPGQGAMSAELDTASFVPKVEGRQAYNKITDARLFGDAGAMSAPPEPVDTGPAEPEAPVVTALNLRLLGTTATGDFSSAIIEDGTRPGMAESYTLGQAVTDRVTLLEVHPRHVVILNRQITPEKRERLDMDSPENQQMATAAAVARPTMPESGANDRVNLNRQEVMQDLMLNYQDLVTKVKPELYRDASGNVVGVTASNIGQIPIAQKLGLQDGDVLQTVNNEQIDSEAKIMQMITKYQTSNSFRIGILRNGKPKVVTYRLN